MQEDRRDAAETDEDGGGRDEEYEINSMGKPETGREETEHGQLIILQL